MSYTKITGMRSNRYPLMGTGDGLGCGCGCGGSGRCGSMGQTEKGKEQHSYLADVVALGTVGAMSIGLLFFFTRDVKPNRRRRRRRSSRRR